MTKNIGVTDEAIWQMRQNKTPFKVIAQSLGISIGAVQGRIFRYEQSQKKKGVEPKPELFDAELGEPLEIHGDAMIIGDVHVPTTDYDFAQLVGAVAKKNKIKKLIIAGDFFNMDMFSSYPQVVDHATWKQEKMASLQLMKEWNRVFDEIYIIMGNHDRRLQKWTNGFLDDEDIFAHLMGNAKTTTSNWGHCILKTDTGDWRITHPKNYSVLQLNVVDHLANKFQQHIVGHHEHHLAKGWDRFKRYVVINNGGLFDSDKMAYVMLDDGKNPNMAKGFTMIKGGYATVYGEEPFTNWDEVL